MTVRPNNKFIGITGTTCVGKSAVAVEVAKRLRTSVISADSMQIYKGMDIGTAKITTEEMQGVPHYMLDICAPSDNFSSFLYQERAVKIIENCVVPPIVAGGTAFYFDSLLFPPEFGSVSDRRHDELLQILHECNGLDKLCEMLRTADEAAYGQVDRKNPKRVLRALEIAENGQSRACGTNVSRKPRFECKIFVLQRDRSSLYEQIERRVDNMMAQGLVDEVKKLVNVYGVCETSAFQAIGYKEIVEYLQGKTSLDEAVSKIKINTRHYAKRQISYFKRLPNTVFIDVDGKNTDEIANVVVQQSGELLL